MMKIILLLLLTLSYSQVFGQTLRPGHWLNDDLRYYQHRGGLWQFSPLERPYSLQTLLQEMKPTVNEPGGWFMERMTMEENSDQALTWFQYDQALQSEKESRLHSVLRLGLGGMTSSKLQAFTSFYIDDQLDADSTYIGKRQSGMAAFTDQAYLLYNSSKFTVKFGRDYLVWGPGIDASLLISAAARPMDHLYFSWNSRLLKFSYFTAVLDCTDYALEGKPSQQNRFLSGHRLEWRPLKYLRMALSETAIFGGPGAGLDLALMNPLIFYTGEEANGPQTANVMAAFDVAVIPINRWMVYGTLLLDDIQLENQNVDDRGEPAEYGLLTGLNWADPLRVEGVDLFAEYTRVTNRTYNGQGGAWEKYLHRNVPVGHFLGNDFDRWIAGLRWRPNPFLRAKLYCEHRRRGEGRVNRPFDAPWRDMPAGIAYSEPFPTGVVESSDRLTFSLRWQPRWWGSAQFDVAYRSVANVENQIDVQERMWEMRLLFSFEFFGSYALK